MREKKRGKRLLALLLAVSLLATSVPVQAALLNAPEMTGAEEGAEGLEVPAGTEEPAGNTEGEEVPAEPEPVLRKLEGTAVLTEAGAVLSGIPDIRIRFYEQETFDPESRENPVLAEAITEPDGTFALPELPEGVYRVAFQFLDPEQKAEDYQVIQPEKENGEEPKYQFAFPEEEEKEVLDCFAYIESYVVEEGSSLELKLEKREAEIIPEVTPEATPEVTPEVTPEAEPETSPEVTPETNSEATPEVTPEITPEVDSERESETKAFWEKYESLLTVEELKKQAETEVYATVEMTGQPLQAERTTWSFHAYYVNQDDRYYVEKNDDFNLKYQMEFHTDLDLERGDVEIRIPEALLTEREGEPVRPSDIAVPWVDSPDQSVESRTTPFNYYVDQEKGELVFFNYDKIIAGTNAAWQVLYKNVKVMEITDMTAWSLKPEIGVTIRGTDGSELFTDTKDVKPLEGLVDTYAELISVSKKAYHAPGKSYTPGLYTESQVEAYLSGELPEKYAGENFRDYRFVVWEVDLTGKGTQPWNLLVKDFSGIEGQNNVSGEVVGYRNIYHGLDSVQIEDGKDITDLTEQVIWKSKEDSWRSELQIVTAYPADKVQNGSILNNTFTAVLQPYDKKDEIQEKEDTAQWSYSDYNWIYTGDRIGVQKGDTDTYEGWLEVFWQAMQNEEDFGNFSFSTTGIFRGYGLTHAVANENGQTVGTYLDGTKYKLTTADDFMYVYPSAGEDTEGVCLNQEDYYFTNVSIRQEDVGYDVWEDEETAPESADGVDQKTVIYAMYETSRDWEVVTELDWNPSGIVWYEFSPAQLEKKPWRVKVEHETVNYSTTCDIDVTVRLRHTSDTLRKIMEEYRKDDMITLRLEDISGVSGSSYTKEGFDRYWHSESTDNPNYQEPGLIEATKVLYPEREDGKEGGLLLQRDNAYKNLNGLDTHAAAYKTAKSSNDPDNSRVLVDFTLTAHDGYEIYGSEGVTYLKQSGVPSPGRNDVAFYDLLPYGMRFDPSQEVKAGRIINLNGSYQTQPGSWDKSQVTVTVDSKQDIIENYRGTGRTMVVFHLHYDGADSAVYSNGQWMEGWGVSFQAYYDWKDLQVAQKGTNISAFKPEDREGHPLKGKPLYGKSEGEDKEVYCDNGEVPSDEYAPFRGGHLNEETGTDIPNVLYAQAAADEDIAVANQSKITKLVRADSDRFGVYGPSAVTEPGGGYTYDITVSNAKDQAITDIVIFDRLEYAAEDRKDDISDPMQPFEEGSWYGTFQSVVTEGLKEEGIIPEIWYNEKRDAEIPSGEQKPGEVLTEVNGWMRAEDYGNDSEKLKNVKAVAVDLGDYKLQSMESVTFQIKMKAPGETGEARYAYNNPAYYALHTDTDTAETVEGDAARVRLGEKKSLEICKVFEGNVPDQVQDTEFHFQLYQEEKGKKIPFANQEYQLWEDTESGWVQNTDRLYATDGSGFLVLRAGEKAVFPDLPDPERIHAEEEESPFWKVVYEESSSSEAERILTVKNTYRPVLYVQKKLQGVPEGKDVSQETFTFQLETGDGTEENWKPFAEEDFWYVDSVRLDGGIPQILGEGKTDIKGQFKIREGEILALPLEEEGISYRLSEILNLTDSVSWICEKKVKTGTIPVLGASEQITNIYKWKNLFLTKSLTHQDPTDCEQAFTFQIRKVTQGENGEEKEIPLKGNRWTVVKEDGTESQEEGESGYLDEKGTFSCACAGKVIKIEHLEAGETYVVEETESGELYRPVHNPVEIEMPLYSSSQEAEFVNDYLKRSLSVSKTVIYDAENPQEVEQANQRVFTMSAEVKGKALADYPYTLTENGVPLEGEYRTDENGKFRLKNGQTAVFADVGVEGTAFKVTEEPDEMFEQIYPAGQQPHEGELGAEGSSVSFVNGTKGGLLLRKEYVYAGTDEQAKEYVELMKNKENAEGQKLREQAAVTLTLEGIGADGKAYMWPKKDTKVTVVDDLDGQSISKIWKGSDTFEILPWQTIVLEAYSLGDMQSYILTEARENQHQVFVWKEGKWLEVSQKEPAEDQGVNGTIEENPTAKIVNLVSSVPMEGSAIEKRMTVGAESVPEGAELVWRLEQFDGEKWNPAEGVKYLTFDESGVTCDRTLETGSDGKIVLRKTASGFPSVKFTEVQVFLNLYQGMKEGDLRLVELPEESDESWGLLAGYGTTDDEYGFSMDTSPDQAVAFVNSNRTAMVEIEKKMEHPSDATFTMLLEQVLSYEGTWKPNISEDFKIMKKRPGSGLPYTVHDSASGEQVSGGVTGKQGELRLRAGQYARLELPDNTLWTVQEEQKADHVLKDLTGSGNVVQLGENLMLVGAQAERVAVLNAVYRSGKVLVGQTLKPEDFEVQVIYSDGEKMNLAPDEYTISPEIVEVAGPLEVTVHWIEGKLDKTVALDAVGKIALTGEMVNQGVINAETGEKVVLNTGDVVIPKYIIWEGAEYQVAAIGSYAFSRNLQITSVVFPDGLEAIENEAFGECKNLSGELKIPESVNYIGNVAFEECNFTGDLVIPNGVKSIGLRAFYACEGFDGNLVLPSGITVIQESAFAYCSNLKGSLDIPDSVISIGIQAFQACSSLETLNLPESVSSIEYGAFQGCSNLTGYLDLSNVTTLEGRAFDSCAGLTGVKIGAGVSSIGYYAFYDCSGLTELQLSEGTISIEENAFAECVGLKGELKIPDSVTKIAKRAFYNCSGFETLKISKNIVSIGERAFADCNGFTGNLILPESLVSIGNEAFDDCRGFTGNLIIPGSVTSIGEKAFVRTRFTSITVNKPQDSIPGAPWGWDGTVTWTGTTPAALPRRKEDVS